MFAAETAAVAPRHFEQARRQAVVDRLEDRRKHLSHEPRDRGAA